MIEESLNFCSVKFSVKTLYIVGLIPPEIAVFCDITIALVLCHYVAFMRSVN